MQESNTTQTTYGEVQEQLSDLLRRRVDLDAQVLQARRKLHALRVQQNGPVDIATAQPVLNPGLTDEIRNILGCSPEPLSVDEVLSAYRSLGHDTSRYRNPRSCVQTILTRLVLHGEAEAVDVRGAKAYRPHTETLRRTG